MIKYQPKELEVKWRKRWIDEKIYASDLTKNNKFYVLAEFAYPSGDLHIGHWFTWGGADIYARMRRMQGYQVFFPNGFDAFGLPAENAAIKRNIHPFDWTMDNIRRMKEQFFSMGGSFTFDHQVITCKPEYYKWNQWIFLKMRERGLAYREKYLSNWCETCQTVLANEGVESGTCWRCHNPIVQKDVEQWFFKITDFAERLIWPENPKVDWPKAVRDAQNAWIGKSKGMVIYFPLFGSKDNEFDKQDYIEIFTTRQDTIYGVTFLVLSPEHYVVTEILNKKIKVSKAKLKEISEYVSKSRKKSELQRKESKDKTGIDTGLEVLNPLTGEEIPVWIADYVLSGYGTGAIMAVPAHDSRDLDFAQKFHLPVKTVVLPFEIGISGQSSGSISVKSIRKERKLDLYEGEGIMINSEGFTDLPTEDAREKISQYLVKHNLGQEKTTFHLHDWSISRQRYWGTPIPILYCKGCWNKFEDKKNKLQGRDYIVRDGVEMAIVPVPEKDLPVELPYDVDYTPTGKPPLATNSKWMHVKCPVCGGEAQRDTETMDTFIDSSWYFFRYLDPSLDNSAFDISLAAKIMPVDIYFGGAEHTLGHTLYSRFFTKFFKTLDITDLDEFARRRINHGIVLGPDNQKMSKSRGNVINPDDEVKKFGADAVRVYMAFFMPYDGTGPWVSERVWGSYRFLERVWQLYEKINLHISSAKIDLLMMHKTISKVTKDINNIKFNTAISALMEWLNYLNQKDAVSKEEYKTFLLLLAPIAPFITEELWNMLGEKFSIHLKRWPEFSSEAIKTNESKIAVLINGKPRGEVIISDNISEDDKKVLSIALEIEKIKEAIGKRKIIRTVYVPGKIINLVLE